MLSKALTLCDVTGERKTAKQSTTSFKKAAGLFLGLQNLSSSQVAEGHRAPSGLAQNDEIPHSWLQTMFC